MPQEIKNLINGLNKDFEEFKKTNDARLESLEKKGVAPEEKEKLEKIEKSLQTQEERMEQFKTALERPGKGKGQDDSLTKEAKSAFNKYMRKGRIESEDQQKIISSYSEEMKALSVDNDPDGGFLVRPEVGSGIIERVFESSPIRQFADTITISSDAYEEPVDFDEAESGWVGERQSRPNTDTPELQMLRIPVHEIYANPKATQKILDDSSVDMEAWLQRKVSRKFARDEASAFVSGDGIGKPKGITQYAAGTSYGQIEQINSGANGDVTADGLINLQGALFEEFQMNARFMMKRELATEVRKLKDQDNRYLWTYAGDDQFSDRRVATLLGRPVHYAADMPEAATNSLSIAYGDFLEGYLIVDRIGIRVLRDPYSNKPFIHFYTTKRVGGAAKNTQALKLQKLATS